MNVELNGKVCCMDHGGRNNTLSSVRVNTQTNQFEVINLSPSAKKNITLSKLLLTYEQMEKIRAFREANARKSGPVLLTRAFLDTLGPIRIGEITAKDSKLGETFTNFKIYPARFDEVCAKSEKGKLAGIRYGEAMACFIYALLMQTLRSEKTTALSLSDIKSMHLYVGCPSTGVWTNKKPLDQYAALVKAATGAGRVTIVPESRAALFSNVNKRHFKALNAQKGILVFDFGSSTADCTFMKLGVGKLEFSWRLGASEIEHNMMTLARDKVCGDSSFMPSAVSCAEVREECCENKEKYYDGLLPSKKLNFSFTDESGTEMDKSFLIDDAFMHEAVYKTEICIEAENQQMRSGSWAELCRQFFLYAKKQLARKGYDVSDIVLTGGASKMPFIEDICKEVFGAQHNVIVEEAPEYTVSNGLAWVAIVEDRFDACKQSAVEEVKGYSEYQVSAVRDALIPKIKDFLVAHIYAETDKWAEQEEDSSLNELNDRIKTAINNDKGSLNRLIDAELDKWKANLCGGICKAVNNQATHLFSPTAANNLLLPKDVWQNMDASHFTIQNFDANTVLQALNLNSILRKFAKVAIVITYAGLFSLAGFGPISKAIAALIGAAIGILLSFAIDDDDMNEKRKKSQRSKAAKQLKKHLAKDKRSEELSEEIRKDFNQFDVDYDTMIKENVHSALGILTLRRFDAESFNAAAPTPGSEKTA